MRASCRDCGRFIPTHVGNGSISEALLKCATVHPHACGERLEEKGAQTGLVRFIPTHVGNGRRFVRRLD